MKAVTASKIVLDSIGLRDRPESLIRESQPRTRFSARKGSSRVQAADRNNFRLSIRPTTIVRACADNGLGVQKPAAARISGRVGFRGTPGRSGVSAGLRAVNNAAEGTALAEFACC